MNPLRIGIVALGAITLISIIMNGWLYYKNYIDISPDHPHSAYRYLFPGLSGDKISGTDTDQLLAHSFVFVIPRQGEGEYTYDLALISRDGCKGFSAIPAADSSIDLSSYIGKPIIVEDFAPGDQESGAIVVERARLDEFVNDHLYEFRQACNVPFERFGL